MRVLVGCEESGVVRRAFRALGHDAWSCDLLPARDGSEFHIEGDVREAIADGSPCLDPHFSPRAMPWDLAIFHPPCTHLAGSGARWLTNHWVHKKGCPSNGKFGHGGDFNGPCRWHTATMKRRERAAAVAFFRACFESNIPRIACENPVGMLSTLFRKPDQYIQPWQFGHGEQKKTGLWLKNLPPLVPTNIVSGREQRIWKMPPGPDRARARSETYAGIAQAMAAQWSVL